MPKPVTPLLSPFRTKVALLLAAAPALAQSGVVSPARFASVEGNSSQTWISGTTNHRVLQVHDDVTGTPRILRGITLRRSAPESTAADASYMLRVNAWCSTAATTASTASATFASNHGADRVQVLTSRDVTFPATSPQVPFPNPFVHSIPFDTPFSHAGTGGLCFELQVIARTNLAALAAHDAVATTTNPPIPSVAFGSGCIATGRTTGMVLAPTSTVTWSNGAGRLTVSGSRAPANAPVVAILGFSSTSWSGLPLPFVLPGTDVSPSGTCRLYAPIALAGAATASASGSVPAIHFDFFATVDLDGGNVFGQVLAFDPPANPFGFVLSNGAQWQIVAPVASASMAVGSVVATNNAATTGTVRTAGLIVRFEL